MCQQSRTCFLILGAVLVGGCAKIGAQSSLTGERRLATVTAGAPIPGYTHSLSRSRFPIGQAPMLEVNMPTLQRWRGVFGGSL